MSLIGYRVGVVGICLVVLVGCDSCGSKQERGADAGKAGQDAGEEGKKKAIVEVEPNNTEKQATLYTQTSVSPGSPIVLPFSGVLADADDVDYVRIPATKEGTVRVLRVEPVNGGDLALVWGRDGVFDSASEGDAEEVANLTTEAVVVGVRAGKTKGTFPLAYRLVTEHRGDRAGVEVESEKASVWSAPGDMQGLVNFRGDIDLYDVDLKNVSGKVLMLELVAPAGVGLRAEIKALGEVLGRLEVDESDQERRAVFPNLGLPEGAKLLNVTVRAVGDAPGVREGYTLRALKPQPLPEGVVLEMEQGEEAMALERSGQVQGYLHHSDDRDRFAVTIPGDEGSVHVLTVKLSGKGRNWSLAMGDGRIDAEGVGGDEVLCNKVVRPGVVEFTVAATEASETENLEGRYTLDLEWRTRDGEEIEPNATTAQATPLTANDARKGVFYPSEDVDVYLFRVGGTARSPKESPKEPKKPKKAEGLRDVMPRLIKDPPAEPSGEDPIFPVEVRVFGPLVNPTIDLLDGEGIALAQSDRRGRGEEEVVKVDLPEGLYYIRLKPGRGTVASCAASYTLKTRIVQ